MSFLSRLFRRRQLERELDTELAFHVDEETRRLMTAGVPETEARRRALSTFGGIEPIKEAARDARGTRWVENFWHDLRYTGRMMRRGPVFTAAAILSLALGIGANATMFSIADALLVRPLPVDRPHELYFIDRAGFGEQNLRFSGPSLDRFRAVPGAKVAAMSSTSRMQLTRGSSARFAVGQLVTGDWFDLLGIKSAEGRVLTADDTRELGKQPVAVLSEAYWAREFNRDRSVIGTTVEFNRTSVTVVGVAAAGFDGLTVGERVDVWLPVTMQNELHYQSNASNDDSDARKPWLPQDGIQWLTLVLRVSPPAQADSVIAGIRTANHTAIEDRVAKLTLSPERREYVLREHAELLPAARGLSPLRDGFSGPLTVLMSTVAIVLLIACANLAGLLLARSAARAREFALRLSLGAGRGRLVRQLLTESVTLACLGGIAGMLLSRWGGAGLLRLASSGSAAVPLQLPVDWRLVAFTFGVSISAGLLFGLAPALRWSKPNLQQTLKTGGRVVEGGGRRGLPFGKVLVIAQIGLSLALLVFALLFLRTFKNLLQIDTGFEKESVITARFDPRLSGFSEAELPGLYERLLVNARTIPGVRSASLALSGPVTGSQRTSGIIVQGYPQVQGSGSQLREDYIGPDYFGTMGTAILQGRDFSDRDREKMPKVAIVNEAMVRHFFPDGQAVGKRIGYGDPLDVEIVGVARDVKVDGLREPAPPMAYYPLLQNADEFVRNLYVRVSGPTEAARGALTRAVAAADKNLAVREVVTLRDLAERTVSRERLVSQLTAMFGVLAVIVACLGLYGTISYSVMRRTNEIGVRLALGAAPVRVLWLVLRETLVVVVIGAAVGIAILLPTLKYVSTLLYGLSPRDPATLAAATAALLVVGGIAGAVPAWRASRVDPLSALRAE